MTPSAKAALQIALNETIKNRDNLKIMAEQYELRANTIQMEEIPELENKIEELRTDIDGA